MLSTMDRDWTDVRLGWPRYSLLQHEICLFSFKGRDLLIETQCTEHSHRSSRSDVKRYYATGHNLDPWAWGIPLYSSTTALRAWQWCPKVQKHRMYDTLILLPFLFFYCTSGSPTRQHLMFSSPFSTIWFTIKYIGSLHRNAKHLLFVAVFFWAATI